MIKRFVISAVCAAILIPEISEAKVTRRELNILQTSVPETTTIADGVMDFTYDYSYSVDTVSNGARISDVMLLQVAPGVSKFSSYRNMRVDSLIAVTPVEQILANASKFANGESMSVFKNYPQGKITHAEKICQDWFRYEEDMPDFEWVLTDSVITVLGYECRGARCHFRGRDYEAFYTEDVPVMDGPWKFCGLPGLIMRVSDTDGDYVFECVGMNFTKPRAITIYDVPYNRTVRKKFYETRHRYDINPYTYAETVSGIHVTVYDETGNPAADAYDPMDLTYDYIERDWRDK